MDCPKRSLTTHELDLHGMGRVGRDIVQTHREYLRAVRQLTAFYMVAPDHLKERQVEKFILYLRDELGVAKGRFAPMFFGLKFFYVQTLGYAWPLFTKIKSASPPGSHCPT